MKSVLYTCATLFILVTTINAQCDPGFKWGSYYANHMVVQRPPARPMLWGYAPVLDQDVIINLDTDAQTVITKTYQGGAGVVWVAFLEPIASEGPHVITAQLAGTSCVITLSNVLVGDVYICSGQSNMEHRLDRIDDPQPDIEDVVNYPKIRTFIAAHAYSLEHLHDLAGITRNWAEPTPANMAGFSAVCWLFARNLFKKYGRPLGLIQSTWGGTRIEAWSSPDALNQCYTTYPPGDAQNAATALYNAMIYPLLPLPIFGAIWYQGEANAGGDLRPQYACMVKAMVGDWRAKWLEQNPEMDPTFPFGQVQLAPNSPNDQVGGFPEVRWFQTDSFGYAPNANMDKIYIAVAADLPDFDSPYGSIHPRYKRQVADRLALAAYNVAYGSTDEGIFQGPLPTQISLDGTNIRINYGLPLQYGDTTKLFEICCGADASATCSTGTAGTWFVTSLVEQNSDNIALSNPCTGTQLVTGFRYLWRESPCPELDNCAIYSVENNLPAPPYRYSGAILAGRPVILKH